MIHVHAITVRGFHCDLYGHVNNARYLEFLEEARWAYVEETPALGGLAVQGLGFVVAAISIQYKRPAGLGTVLEIRTSPLGATANRAVLRQEVVERERGKTVAEAEVTFAIVDLATGRAVGLSEPMRDWFASPAPGETA